MEQELDTLKDLQMRVALLEARISHAARVATAYRDPKDALAQVVAALAGNHRRSHDVNRDVYSGKWDGYAYDDCPIPR